MQEITALSKHQIEVEHLKITHCLPRATILKI
jgi:hypothetical protein